MDTPGIAHVEGRTQPDALMLFVKILLARLGGQVTLTKNELVEAGTYDAVCIMFNPNPDADEPCVLTLLTKAPQNDKPTAL